MNLGILFQPLPEEFEIQPTSDLKSVAAQIDGFIYKFPDWQEADIAIFGVNDNRGKTVHNTGENPADVIRRSFYKLKKGTGRYRLTDLGNLSPGITLEETHFRIREVVETLIANNTIPVILGSSHDLDYGQFLAYETWGRPVNLVMVDSALDMTEHAGAAENQLHLHKILMHEPNYLFSFSQIGHQSYLTEPEMMAVLEKLNFETIRIGEVHKDLPKTEPLIRHADLMSFDVSAIRFQDAPGYSPANPFGLTGEEACQLAWYAGLNDQLTSFGVYEYDPTSDAHGLGASTVATMVWYFIEGYYQRKNELDFTSKKFTKYQVAFHDNPHKMIFYKSNVSDKWWLEVENLTPEKDNHIVPCTYEDYLQATNGEVPNRWILTQARMG
ncbi:formimidoylglutamase [Adhaeribacter soli]|uniref:Formimidoylglutamase n=1 Tax=Adhaeribacter soli TaxID=2607655 RepID=A0A5N1INS8_9BACT|nr:formimidoylglutamase [Adhaeribacter soli]KAA9325431.1 formimidoylglutamase [Adhaeribacter soli]